MGRSAHPLRRGGCSSPASHLCTAPSEQSPSDATLPWWIPRSHPWMTLMPVTIYFYSIWGFRIRTWKIFLKTNSYYVFCLCFNYYFILVYRWFTIFYKFQVYSKEIYIYVCIYIFLFQIPFSFRLWQNTEQSSLCYTVGLCWLSF